MAMARYRPDAFPKGPRTRKTPVRGNILPPCIQIQLLLARYACYVSKKPRKAPWGIRRANILPPRGVFAARSPQIMHGAQILPPSDGLGPCAGVPTPPAPRQYPPPANACHSLCPLQPGTSRRWASAATIRRMACSSAEPRGTADCVTSTGGPTTECCAELGLNSKTVNKWVQNRRLRPQARPGLRQRCQKHPSKGRIPLDGTIGTPPTLLRAFSN